MQKPRLIIFIIAVLIIIILFFLLPSRPRTERMFKALQTKNSFSFKQDRLNEIKC